MNRLSLEPLLIHYLRPPFVLSAVPLQTGTSVSTHSSICRANAHPLFQAKRVVLKEANEANTLIMQFLLDIPLAFH